MSGKFRATEMVMEISPDGTEFFVFDRKVYYEKGKLESVIAYIAPKKSEVLFRSGTPEPLRMAISVAAQALVEHPELLKVNEVEEKGFPLRPGPVN